MALPNTSKISTDNLTGTRLNYYVAKVLVDGKVCAISRGDVMPDILRREYGSMNYWIEPKNDYHKLLHLEDYSGEAHTFHKLLQKSTIILEPAIDKENQVTGWKASGLYPDASGTV